jgi:uncharacterized protein YdeI (YjbR/CyaY-like superfamily)
MGKKDKGVDAYIAKSQDFAKPVLKHLRELVHEALPDVEENLKWSMPHFGYHGSLAGMAAFKNHCAFGFWKAAIMKDPAKIFPEERKGMGHLGKITSLKDLPSDKIIKSYLKEAAQLNIDGIKVPRAKKPAAGKKELDIPDYFTKMLKKNKAAEKNFNDFSYSHKKEYVEWITEAKTEETRKKRLDTALEWITEGKGRHWKYVRK